MSGKLVLHNATRIKTPDRHQLAFAMNIDPTAVWDRIGYWEDVRHIDAYRLQISPPFKPRTTGKNSQNTKYRGLCRDIMDWSGESMTRVNQQMKLFMDEHDPEGYPKSKGPAGFVDFLSEADLDTRTESRLIEWTLRFMAEFGVPVYHHTDDYETVDEPVDESDQTPGEPAGDDD